MATERLLTVARGSRARLKRVYAAARAWAGRTFHPTDWQLLDRELSSAEKDYVRTALLDKAGLFHPSYGPWRDRRCRKILELYGRGYFAGKKILELGSGHGDIGAFLARLGADVLCVEGRARNVALARAKHANLTGIRFVQFDLDQDFSRFGRFDLIVNLGLLYHLKNVDAHLRCCFALADEMVLESVVCDSLDAHEILLVPERADVDEEAMGGMGSRPSPFYIERLATENGFGITRCFTADLNYGHQFRYDWRHGNDGRPSGDFVLRRFWRFRKSNPRP